MLMNTGRRGRGEVQARGRENPSGVLRLCYTCEQYKQQWKENIKDEEKVSHGCDCVLRSKLYMEMNHKRCVSIAKVTQVSHLKIFVVGLSPFLLSELFFFAQNFSLNRRICFIGFTFFPFNYKFSLDSPGSACLRKHKA